MWGKKEKRCNNTRFFIIVENSFIRRKIKYQLKSTLLSKHPVPPKNKAVPNNVLAIIPNDEIDIALRDLQPNFRYIERDLSSTQLKRGKVILIFLY